MTAKISVDESSDRLDEVGPSPPVDPHLRANADALPADLVARFGPGKPGTTHYRPYLWGMFSRLAGGRRLPPSLGGQQEEAMDAMGRESRVGLPDGLDVGVHGHCRISETSGYRAEAAAGEPTTWSGIEPPATRVPHVVTDYRPTTSRVLIYDFLMPLTHEAPLRTTLDALFFRDTLVARLRTLRNDELEEVFPRAPEQGDRERLEQILDFIQERFVGYSITHVSGRCRFGPLRSRDRVSEFERQGARYLMDETTAVTRFVFLTRTIGSWEESVTCSAPCSFGASSRS